MKYATRINSFLRKDSSLTHALSIIGKIQGIDYVDLNFPEHFEKNSVAMINDSLQENNLKINAINLRFRQDFLNGVFTNSDKVVQAAAVELSIKAAEICDQLEGKQIIIWLSYDGFDYPFQMDYLAQWNQMVYCFRQICDSTDLPVSIEYKPYEERVFAFLDSFGTTRLMLHAVDRKNLGITLDVCHMLMKHENPAMAAQLLLDEDKLYSIHLNDGYGRTDDGLMIGSAHPWNLLELFFYLIKYKYDGVIYFDTFPVREDSIKECHCNLKMCNCFEQIIETVGKNKIENIIRSRSGTTIMDLLYNCLNNTNVEN